MLKRSRSCSPSPPISPPSKKFECDENAGVDKAENTIPELNDDCLLKIFSFLSIKDLCAVKDCSLGFSTLADSTVQTKWRNGVLGGCEVNIDGDDDAELLLLTKFGHLISHLSVTESALTQFSEASCRSALGHCVSLKSLTVKFVDISLIPFEILQNIEELRMYGCYGDECLHMKLIKACKSLKHLELMTVPKECLLKAINEQLSIESVCWKMFGATNSTFVNEIKMLSKLKKLKKLLVEGYGGYTFRGISLSYRFPQVTETINVLARNSSLEELSISFFDPDDDFFKAFNKFVNLKRCVLSTYVEIPDASLSFATNFKVEKRDGLGFVQREYIITPKQAV